MVRSNVAKAVATIVQDFPSLGVDAMIGTVQAVKDCSENVRMDATKAVTTLGQESSSLSVDAMTHLAQALKDGSWKVRKVAA